MRKRDKFSLLESYSGRYLAASPRPLFSASDLQSLSLTLEEPGFWRTTDARFKVNPRPATTKPLSSRNSSLLLRPCEVTNFQSDSSRASHLFLKAHQYRAEGFFQQATQLYTQLLEEDPSHLQATINLGVCYMKLGQFNRAKDLHEAALGSLDPRLLYNHSILLVLLSDLRTAVQTLAQAQNSAAPTLLREICRLKQALEASIQEEERGETPRNRQETTISGLLDPTSASYSSNFYSPKSASTTSIRQSMWKVFKTVDQYTSVRPQTSIGSIPDSRKTLSRVSRRSLPSNLKQKSTSKAELEPSKVPATRLSPTVSFLPDPPKVRVCGALLQEDLEDPKVMKAAEVDQELAFSVRAKAVEVSSALRKDAAKFERAKELLPSANLDPVLGSKLTSEALYQVRTELRQPSEARNYDQLVQNLQKLRFFTKFQGELRVKMLHVCELHTAQQGELLFAQGEQGDFMYVILHGSVNVMKLDREFGGDPLVINTLYDGDSFGELGLFSQEHEGKLEGRSASCYAAEVTDLACIRKEDYHSIMKEEVEKQLEQTIAFLAQLPFFKGFPSSNLIPLASNLRTCQFRFNDTILSTGDCPSGLHIILTGSCGLYTEGFSLRPKRLKGYASVRIRTPAPKPFRIGNTEFHSPKAKDWDPESEQMPGPAITAEDIRKSEKLRKALEAFFKDQRLEDLLQAYYITRERIFKRHLYPKDWFGGRALLDGAANEHVSFLKPSSPSKFSIIAESSEVEMILITRSQLPLLGERLMGHIRLYLGKGEDWDCPSEVTQKAIETEFRQWSGYKARVVDLSRKEQFLVRSRDRPGEAI